MKKERMKKEEKVKDEESTLKQRRTFFNPLNFIFLSKLFVFSTNFYSFFMKLNFHSFFIPTFFSFISSPFSLSLLFLPFLHFFFSSFLPHAVLASRPALAAAIAVSLAGRVLRSPGIDTAVRLVATSASGRM